MAIVFHCCDSVCTDNPTHTSAWAPRWCNADVYTHVLVLGSFYEEKKSRHKFQQRAKSRRFTQHAQSSSACVRRDAASWRVSTQSHTHHLFIWARFPSRLNQRCKGIIRRRGKGWLCHWAGQSCPLFVVWVFKSSHNHTLKVTTVAVSTSWVIKPQQPSFLQRQCQSSPATRSVSSHKHRLSSSAPKWNLTRRRKILISDFCHPNNSPIKKDTQAKGKIDI